MRTRLLLIGALACAISMLYGACTSNITASADTWKPFRAAYTYTYRVQQESMFEDENTIRYTKLAYRIRLRVQRVDALGARCKAEIEDADLGRHTDPQALQESRIFARMDFDANGNVQYVTVDTLAQASGHPDSTYRLADAECAFLENVLQEFAVPAFALRTLRPGDTSYTENDLGSAHHKRFSRQFVERKADSLVQGRYCRQFIRTSYEQSKREFDADLYEQSWYTEVDTREELFWSYELNAPVIYSLREQEHTLGSIQGQIQYVGSRLSGLRTFLYLESCTESNDSALSRTRTRD